MSRLVPTPPQLRSSRLTLVAGNIFKADPLLILRPESTEWMSKVFASPDHEAHCRLLMNIKEFLVSEGERKSKGVQEKDLTALIGHAESSDSG